MKNGGIDPEFISISDLVYQIRSCGYEASVSLINKLMRLGILEKPKRKEGKKALFHKSLVNDVCEILHYRLLGASLKDVKNIVNLEKDIKKKKKDWDGVRLDIRDELVEKREELKKLLNILKQKNSTMEDNMETISRSIENNIEEFCDFNLKRQ